MKNLLQHAMGFIKDQHFADDRTTLAQENERYWTEHNVTFHTSFLSAQASLDYFHWRNAQYCPYIDLMPVNGQDDKAVLDYGCGPGHDLIGFAHYSRPKRLIGADISSSSLAQAKARLQLHDTQAELLRLTPTTTRLGLADQSVDYIHSSGVIHHTPDPAAILREFRRIIHPSGRCRIMVYNYHSLWVHLYVAYVKRIKEKWSSRWLNWAGWTPRAGNSCSDRGLREAFAKTTDGESCPISRVYKPEEFSSLARAAGFQCRFLGAAVSMWELSLLPKRFEAVMNRKLEPESRQFLLDLEFDHRMLPYYQGHVAGVDGCYELLPM